MKWVQLYGSLNILWHSFLWDWNENWPFPVLWTLLNFPNLLAYWVHTLRAISFRILTSSAEIPSPTLSVFIVMLPKVHLTSHSTVSGSTWETTPSWLSRSLRPFLYSSMHSYGLFLISSASARSIPFLSFIVPILTWNVHLVSPVFLKRSLVFCILFFFSISLHCSCNKTFLFLLALLWNSAFSIFPFLLCLLLIFSAFCKSSSDNHFAFLHCIFFGMVLVTHRLLNITGVDWYRKIQS